MSFTTTTQMISAKSTTNTISLVEDSTDLVALLPSRGLHLKPIARISVSVQLPNLKLPGQSISNWEVSEKLKAMLKPDHFVSLKAVKSSSEFIRFEGELENKPLVGVAIEKLDGQFVKLSGFGDHLRVKAAEAKIPFPQRFDWDSFFRDATNMNEMKPGERPDTIYLRDLPCRWFSEEATRRPSGSDSDGERKNTETDLKGKWIEIQKDTPTTHHPSEKLLQRAFESFGDVRCVDIPMLDSYRMKIMTELALNVGLDPEEIGAFQSFNFGQDLTFDAYVQYHEYVSFCKAMNELRGMKLAFREELKSRSLGGAATKTYAAAIRVDFDKTKHLSDKAVKKRRIIRERLIAAEKEQQAEAKRKEQEEAAKKLQQQSAEEMEDGKKKEESEREEKRKQKIADRKEEKMQRRIKVEERKILIAHRKLQSLRLFTHLIGRIKDERERQVKSHRHRRQRRDSGERRARPEKRRRGDVDDDGGGGVDEEERRSQLMREKEHDMRERLTRNFYKSEERRFDSTREERRRDLKEKEIRPSSTVIMNNPTGSSHRRGFRSSPAPPSKRRYRDDGGGRDGLQRDRGY